MKQIKELIQEIDSKGLEKIHMDDFERFFSRLRLDQEKANAKSSRASRASGRAAPVPLTKRDRLKQKLDHLQQVTNKFE